MEAKFLIDYFVNTLYDSEEIIAGIIVVIFGGISSSSKRTGKPADTDRTFNPGPLDDFVGDPVASVWSATG